MGRTNILLITDLSDVSNRAIEPTVALARKLGARLTLLYVLVELTTVPHGHPFVPPTGLPDEAALLAKSRQELERIRDGIGDDIDVEVEVVLGRSADRAVCDFARSNGFDLIALSSHGRSGLRRLLIGSVAEAILRQSEVPVIVFPPGAERAPGSD